ncbi:MAG: Sec-independent protein translocase subunit TatA/TatB [Planctomycetota bacterium]
MTAQTIAFFGGIGWPEIVIVLIVLLLLFGGKRLPELARGLGRGLRAFKEEVTDAKDTFTKEITDESEDSEKGESQDSTPPAESHQEHANTTSEK